ncbi:MAG: DUF3533 domain-containing protein [Chloroflexi bacterium]|nr:MAG: DUF3533 domain-containing protein [Chloroflexota bacterium]TMC73702.1 MAG: DUF3533 domain-containing protein [Chloroflexota bacterium]
MADHGALESTQTPNQSGGRGRMEKLAPPVVGSLLLLFALVGLIGTAIRDPKPHDIPVGLVGPPPAVQQIATAFGSSAPGAFTFTSYGSEADGRAAVDSRAVDGVVILGEATPRIIVAGAAGDAATGVITAAFTNAFKAQGATAQVEVVHPFAAGDAHGLILFFVVVAVIVCSLVSQALLFGTVKDVRTRERLGVLIGFSILAGLVGMGTAAWIAGGYGSDLGFWAAVGLTALASAAVGAAVAGCVRLLGAPGLALAALVVVLLDLVSSGGPVGSQLLPDFYRWLAPWMPAGPLYSSLRGALYFDGAGLGAPVIVVTAWLVGGLILMLLGDLTRTGRRSGTVVQAPAA